MSGFFYPGGTPWVGGGCCFSDLNLGEKAAAEFVLVRIATNLGKIIKFRTTEMIALASG